MRAIGIIVCIVGGLMVLSIGGIMLGIITLPFHAAGNLVNTAQGTLDKTLNADNAIYNYEWFKQQYEDIQAAKNKLDNARKTQDNFTLSAGARSTWTFEDKQESSRLASVVLGLENHVEQLIADYNARTKMANRAIFENSIIPPFIDSLTFLKR